MVASIVVPLVVMVVDCHPPPTIDACEDSGKLESVLRSKLPIPPALPVVLVPTWTVSVLSVSWGMLLVIELKRQFSNTAGRRMA